MTKVTSPTIIIIFGVTGDLASRSLLPALEAIGTNGSFHDQTKIIGITRRPIDWDVLIPKDTYPWLSQHFEMLQLEPAAADEYHVLAERLDEIDHAFGGASQRLFYLSVPPQVSSPIVSCLGSSGLASQPNTKLLLEKPFGTDLTSAQELVAHIQQYFSEEQIYRIDHFLAKEMAQNIVVFRSANALLKHTWNKQFIESIEVLLHEHIDIEGRANFYEQTGAVRDVIQSHLLQLAALSLMDPGIKNIPAARLAALRAIKTPSDIDAMSFRAQYQGYTDEVATPHSSIETFARLQLESTDEAWQNVPIIITTGKALDTTTTEIRIHYRKQEASEADQLVLHVQPNEGIELDLWVKKPGYDYELEQKKLHFSYGEHYEGLPKAYERVFVDAMLGDHSLFATSDEVLESWRIIDPILKHWELQGKTNLHSYEKGATAAEVAQTAAEQ